MARLLMVLGLLSMVLAAGLILGQGDFKRMLAYSSVEHMGILALGVGLGGAGRYGVMLHAVNHSLTKASLFLVSGNILAAYRSKTAGDVTGLTRALPVTGALWVAGTLAITGSPPFGSFLSEFVILRSAVEAGHSALAFAYLALLAVIFIGMTTIVLRMAQPADGAAAAPAAGGRESLTAVVPPLVLAAMALLLGLHIPARLNDLMLRAADALTMP